MSVQWVGGSVSGAERKKVHGSYTLYRSAQGYNVSIYFINGCEKWLYELLEEQSL
jgi:hypothetical protein